MEKLTEKMSWEEIMEKIMVESNNHTAGFKEWLATKKDMGGYFFNSLLYTRAYNIYHSITHSDKDHFVCISGKEGDGKSTLAIQLACLIDPTFNLKRICFEPIQYLEQIKESKPGMTFQLDEGNLFLFSRESMSFDNKAMVKLFALMRQKNLCTIIAVPNFFTLDSYVRDHRVDTLIHIYNKGKFHCYKGKAIQIISKEGFKYKQIQGIIVPHGTFFQGYFNKDLPTLNDINSATYKGHKNVNFDAFMDDLIKNARDVDGHDPTYVSVKEAAEKLGIHPQTVRVHLDDGTIPGKRLGGRVLVERKFVFNAKPTLPKE